MIDATKLKVLAAGALMALSLPALANHGPRDRHYEYRHERHVEHHRPHSVVNGASHHHRRAVTQRPIYVERPVYVQHPVYVDRRAPIYGAPIYEAPYGHPYEPPYAERAAYEPPGVHYPREANVGGALAGAAIGAAIGSQVGPGHARGATAAIGAVIGGLLGSQF